MPHQCVSDFPPKCTNLAHNARVHTWRAHVHTQTDVVVSVAIDNAGVVSTDNVGTNTDTLATQVVRNLHEVMRNLHEVAHRLREIAQNEIAGLFV